MRSAVLGALEALPVPFLPVQRVGDQQPALVSLDGPRRATPAGAMAVLALPPLGSAPLGSAPVLPRRRPFPSPAPRGAAPGPGVVAGRPAVLAQAWCCDAPTMARLLAGLHRLA